MWRGGTKENKWAGSQGERWMCVLFVFYINVLIIKYNHVFMTLLIASQVIRIFNLKEGKVFSWSVTRAARPSFASVRPRPSPSRVVSVPLRLGAWDSLGDGGRDRKWA